ncbi:MAG: VOC family protein [Pararhodobacter sp.]
MTPQRITLITLGVADLARALAFYNQLGWQVDEQGENIAFFDLGGLKLALFDATALAHDQGRTGASLGTGAVTLAQNFPSPAAVDAAFALALKAGATALKPPEAVFWGGYSGYFADPDGHVWELAHNPFWPLDSEGRLAPPS